MSMTIPATQDQVNQNIANIEARLGQTTPLADKAFTRVIAVMIAMQATPAYKYAADRFLASFAQTAKGADLDLLGNEYAVVRKQATAAVLSVTLTGVNTTVIPVNWVFVGLPNSALYTTQAAGTIAAGTVTVSLAAQVAGVSGNLNPSDTLTMQTAIVGATGIPTVASVTTTGADVETDDAYRIRVLGAQQSQGGGGNASDYRNWAQSVAGVIHAFPFAGPPTGSGITPEPPMRTVYVECDTSIQVDGIAPAGLLTQVRTAITTDPATGLARQPLGLTDGTLYVQAISRTQIYVQITGLNVPAGTTAQCQAAISSALTTYFLSIIPFVPGVDPAYGRNDSITNLTVSKIVQAVLIQFGASASNIGFGLTAITFNSTYTVSAGEKAKLGAVSYV